MVDVDVAYTASPNWDEAQMRARFRWGRLPL